MTTPVNLVLSDKAHDNFVALKKRLGLNQHETITLVLENLDVEEFAKQVTL